MYKRQEILTTVWATYAEEDKFAIMGGTSTMNEPDSIEIAGNESVLDNTVALPSDCVELIDDAATMIHMLNANTFSCGVFRVTDSQNVATVTEKIRDNVLNRQWICGFPDKLVITTIGNYVVSAFGNEEIIDTFQAALESCYEDAELVYEESLL